jgi:hypothetical protein
MYQLIIEDSAGDVTVVPLQHTQISVGRLQGNVVRLTEENVSRRHARFLQADGRIFVDDLGSYGGTAVNGVRIFARTALVDGDDVTIGDYRLTLRDANAAAVVKRAKARRRRPIPLGATAAAWARSANASVAALTGRLKAFWADPLPSWVKMALPEGAPGSLGLGLPMMSTEGGGAVGPSPDPAPASESTGSLPRPTPPPLPAPAPMAAPPSPAVQPPTPRSSLASQILRLRGTLILGAVALVMVVLGVVFAPPRDGRPGGLAAAVRNALPKGAPGVESPGALLNQAQTSFTKGRWSDTLLLLARVSALSPGMREAEDLRRATLAERKNQAAIEAAERALDLENYGLVLEQVAAVPPDSAYRDRAQVLRAAARANLVAQHLAAAQSRQAAGDCRVTQKEAEAALALEPDNPTAKELLARCPRSLASRAGAGQSAPARKRLLAVSRPAKPEPAPDAPPPPRRALAGTSDGVLPPIFSAPPSERPGRRPIESSNPYAEDLR